jgi:alkanesulfonate monooxygenase SsuD/methylene tetrahydromethanopterin reductase-like flavin-dependent oxidoreductase (luciferase family)
MNLHLKGGNPFKLGVFGLNAQGGIAMTRAAERWQAKWDDIVQVAQTADQAGFEILLPLQRWKGFGGETDPRGWCFETFAYAAALSGHTKRIMLYSTVHVPLVHPVFAARALTTIDHASGGRAGLNVVCGWNRDEFDAFGIDSVGPDARYDQGLEWVKIVDWLLTKDEPLDFSGRFYSLKGATCSPKPTQRPRPTMLSAAFSDAGRDFAAQSCDVLFTTFSTIDKASRHVSDFGEKAKRAGRDLDVFTVTHVVCRQSQAEADEYYCHVTQTMADTAAVDRFIGGKQQDNNPLLSGFQRRQRARIAGGFGSYGIVGDPDRVTQELCRIHEAGFAGATVSFIDFKSELPAFIEHVMPRLENAGLRHSRPSGPGEE